MTTLIQQIINKYQGIAPNGVINAVKDAASKTGADFSFLMEKASAESGFDPKATSHTSSATGLFQFIDSTWLKMVKDFGAKYGLGQFASQIQMKDGLPCVDNCAAKTAILNLRKDPEISALMAGEFTAQNKQYLEKNTDGVVGATELYLAHFMGASGAAKFLNARQESGDVPAASLFPREAHANKNVFFDPETGKARSLNEVYDTFAQKFTDDGTAARPPVALTDAGSTAPAQLDALIPLLNVAQALPSSGSMIWAGGRAATGFSSVSAPQVSIDNMLMLAEIRHPLPLAKKSTESVSI